MGEKSNKQDNKRGKRTNNHNNRQRKNNSLRAASNNRGVYWLLIIIITIIDQATKRLAENCPRTSDKLITCTYATNTGVSFGLLNNQGMNATLVWLYIMVLGIMIYFYDYFKKPLSRTGYTLIIAGIIGNLIDRLTQGFVTDFIKIGWWPVFNIADSAIVVGALITAYLVMKEELRND